MSCSLHLDVELSAIIVLIFLLSMRFSVFYAVLLSLCSLYISLLFYHDKVLNMPKLQVIAVIPQISQIKVFLNTPHKNFPYPLQTQKYGARLCFSGKNQERGNRTPEALPHNPRLQGR